MRFWRSCNKPQVFRAWQIFRNKCKDKVCWNLVTGHIGATVTTLLELGFHPRQANYWRFKDAFAEIGTSSWRDYAIVQGISQLYLNLRWKSLAEGDFTLKNLLDEEGPPSLEAATQVKKRLIKDGHGELCYLLDKVVCGGCVFQERFEVSLQCDVCGKPFTAPMSKRARQLFA